MSAGNYNHKQTNKKTLAKQYSDDHSGSKIKEKCEKGTRK